MTLLLLAQKKVTKEKSTPLSRPAASLRYSINLAAAELGLCPQTVLAEIPRFISVARRDTGGLKVKTNIEFDGKFVRSVETS